MATQGVDQGDQVDMARLLLEDVCSDLVRFRHSQSDRARFGAVHIDREYALGPEGTFADLRVEVESERPYFLEVKYGYDTSTLLNHIHRKYGAPLAARGGETRVVLVVDTAAHHGWPAVEEGLRVRVSPHLALEVWDEVKLQSLMAECFGLTLPSFSSAELLSIRERIDQGKERLAFGDDPAGSYAESVLRQSLLWHFGTWRLRELRHTRGTDETRHLVPVGVYDQVVALMADLSGFSRYVRDTPDEATVRQSLTNFYAKARYQVINAGGMLVQFVGDEVVALFGIPDRRPGYVEAAVRTACRLLDIGASVSHDWQRRIDHVQPRRGVHIGMAMGRVQLTAMRPFDLARLATIGDPFDMAARLLTLADQGQIVVSNVLRHALRNSGYEFTSLEPFEARNIGTIQPWRLVSAALATATTSELAGHDPGLP